MCEIYSIGDDVPKGFVEVGVYLIPEKSDPEPLS